MNDIFYVFEGAETTYAAFSRQVASRARALPPCRGEVVAIRAGHGPDFVINLFALWKAGAAPLLLSTRVPSGMAADLMDTTRARLLITDNSGSIGTDRLGAFPRVISAAHENSGRQGDSNAEELPD